MVSVSVVMTARNAQAHIASAVRSVLSQTWTDLELVLVDDGSQDNTLAQVEEATLDDGRVVIHRAGAIGRSAALNTALSISSGEYVAILDADNRPAMAARAVKLPALLRSQRTWR